MSAELKPIADFYRSPGREGTRGGIPQLVSLKQLAEIWQMPYTWLQEACRSRCADPLPRYQFGRYARVDLNDPELGAWLSRRRAKCGVMH
jgi:hypothetical protein